MIEDKLSAKPPYAERHVRWCERKGNESRSENFRFPTYSIDIFYSVLILTSLADAEVGEDVAEDVVGGDFAGDFAEVVHCFANVLAHEVAADAVV